MTGPLLAYFAEDEDRLTDMWGYLVRANGLIGRAYCIGQSYDSRIVHVPSVAELPPLPIVLASLGPAAVSLKTFQHPAECVYLFGASNRILKETDLAGRDVAHRIFIPSVDGTELFAAQAAAVVLWDREMKNG